MRSRRAARALGQQVAEALGARAISSSSAQQRRRRRRSAATSRRRPRSTHSIAKAIVPPARDRVEAELVAAARRRQHRVRIADAAQRTRARTGSRTRPARSPARPRRRRCARSRSCRRRRTARAAGCASRRSSSGEMPPRRRTSPRLEVARRAARRAALKASRFAAVPSSRYFAVAGPRERCERSRAEPRRSSPGCAHPGLDRPAHRDRLEVLGAEHRAQAAASGVAAVVRDRGEAHARLAGRPDRGDPPVAGERARRLLGAAPPQVRLAQRPVHQHGRRRTAPDQHQRVHPEALARDREVRAR